MTDKSIDAIGVTSSGLLMSGFGLALLFILPNETPLRIGAAVFLALGLLIALLGFAAWIKARQEPFPVTPNADAADVEPRPSRAAVVIVVVSATLIGACFVVGMQMLGATSYTAVALALVGVADVAFVLLGIGGLIHWVNSGGARTNQLSQPGTPPPAPRRWTRWLRGILVLAFFVLVTMSFEGYMVWWHYSHRPRPDTVGYAEFYHRTYTMRIDLPDNWRIDYYGRDRRYPHQGRISDEHGRPRLRVYGGMRAVADLDDVARREAESYKKVEIAFVWSEFRESPQGRWWVYAIKLEQPDHFLDTNALLTVRYFHRSGYHLEFTMPLTAAQELEPLIWRYVQTVTSGAAE